MRKARWIIASLVVFALVAAACGDDDAETSTTTTAAGGAAATTPGGGAATTCTVDRSMKLVGLAEKPPESANAIPDYANGWELAVTEINAAGGACGKPIDFERIPMSPLDVATAKVAYLSALDKKADMTFGMNSSPIVLALAPEVLKAATPNIYLSAASQIFLGAANGVGNEWGFVIRPRNNGSAVIQADFLTKDLNKKKIGLLCAIGAFGDGSCAAAKPAIEAAGATVVSQQSAATDATNLTTQILAFKNAGAEAVLAFEFPNPMVVLFNQAADNALNVPIMGGASAGLAIATKNVKANALANAYGIDDCVPVADTTNKKAIDFTAAYKAKYNLDPGYAAAEAYDTIYLAAEALKIAGKLDKKALADALRTMTYQGVCDNYKADAGQGLHHASYIETFDATGKPKIVKTVAIPAPAGGG
ncbi:MAG TPA: ABC transporter substrate-binding protein [Acidimicrobiales bacterium]|nr:ABC transporter substrate-binding protein [Acidimicrobiales bacterium]